MPQLDPLDPDVVEIDLREMFNKLIKHRQTIFSTVVVCAVVALICSFMATPIFKATSRILVDTKPPKIVKVENVVLPDYTDRTNFFNSQIEILKSHTVAELVFKDLGNYEPWGRRGKSAGRLKPLADAERVENLLKHIKITPVRMTQVIEVNAEDPDPVLAARIANGWSRAYILFSSMDQLIQRRSELESDMSQQLKYLKEKHPVIIGLKGEIEAINTKINSERVRLNKEENSSMWGGDISNVKILDRAQVPLKPDRPRKALNVVLALVLGVFFGGALVFLFESLDQTIKTPADMDQFLNLLSLVVIPRYEHEDDHSDFEPEFLSARALRSTVAEAFRSLRTGIIFSNPDLPKKTFVITSSSPLEGKTMVAINLATVFAQSGERVILVDTDLRSPRLHSVFKIDRGNGVTDILALGKSDIATIIHKTEVPGLDLLTCGAIPPNPSELLGSKKMADLIARLLTMYDRVVFDTPPVLAATDAVVLATQVDATVMVISAGDAHRQAVIRSLNALKSVHARLLGGVLNMVDAGDHGGYYYYLYGENAPKKAPGRKSKGIFKKIASRSKRA